jgi:hypothetical protein
MTGYESKRAAAQDKLAQPAPEPALQEQLAIAQTDWDKANAARGQANLVNGRYILAQPAQEPQRPWVDLTDEEIQDCDPHEDCWHLFKIARAVLAKSKEKNNG